jgi:seryl-tRNA synthetase
MKSTSMVNRSLHGQDSYQTKKGKCTTTLRIIYTWFPTAEVPVTNMFRDVILNENELPVLHTQPTHVFVVKQVLMEHMYVD